MKITRMLKKNEKAHEWFIVDVTDKILGRAAAKISFILSGKHSPDYTPHIDSGAGVIVMNCGKIKISGEKYKEKKYKSYSGYPGGLKETSYENIMAKNPKYILRHAVRGMLPKNKLGVKMLRRLKLYTGSSHEHAAQKPKEIAV